MSPSLARTTWILSGLAATACTQGEPLEGARAPVSPPSLATGYEPPANKQGIDDYYEESGTLDTRYEQFRQLRPGIKKYNLFWSRLESAGVPPSDQPIECPKGHERFPQSAAQKEAIGAVRYRCLDSHQIQTFDRLLARDAAIGAQSAVVVWSAPDLYREPDCSGFTFEGQRLRDGCVPRGDAMDDFEDYIRFLGSRYNGGPHGKIYHFIIWNEVGNAGWYDLSPRIPNRDAVLTDTQKRQWMEIYADMMERAYRALRGTTQSVLLYASLDIFWEAPTDPPFPEVHIGTRFVVEELWRLLGTRVDWSLAVHPYGDPEAPAPPGVYTFSNLHTVAAFQEEKLRQLGYANVHEHPQAILYASEQGWPATLGNESQARFICWAHERAQQLPNVIGVTHNYFQSIEPEVATTERGQTPFGLIPFSAGPALPDFASVPSGQAYLSTRPSMWSRSDNHYCCRTFGLGCAAEVASPETCSGEQSALANPGCHPGVKAEGFTALGAIETGPSTSRWLGVHGRDFWIYEASDATAELAQSGDDIAAFFRERLAPSCGHMKGGVPLNPGCDANVQDAGLNALAGLALPTSDVWLGTSGRHWWIFDTIQQKFVDAGEDVSAWLRTLEPSDCATTDVKGLSPNPGCDARIQEYGVSTISGIALRQTAFGDLDGWLVTEGTRWWFFSANEQAFTASGEHIAELFRSVGPDCTAGSSDRLTTRNPGCDPTIIEDGPSTMGSASLFGHRRLVVESGTRWWLYDETAGRFTDAGTDFASVLVSL